MPSSTSSANMNQIQSDLKRIKEFIADIKRIGGEMPELESAVNRLQLAINTAQDMGEAMEDTSLALRLYTNDLYKACGADEDLTCRAAVDHQWQARNVRWVLSWDQRDSVANNFLRNTLRRYLPKEICKRLDACSN